MMGLASLRQHRELVLLIACVAVSIALLNIPPGQKSSLARSLGAVVFAPADGLIKLKAYVDLLRGDNEVLREELILLSDRLARSEELEKEARRLRRLLDFRESESYRFLPAQLLSFPLSFRERNLLRIDRGRRDGVEAGMPVVSPGGLIGTVFSVDTHDARVQLLMSKNFPVSCRDQRSRVLGVFRWNVQKGFHVERVDRGEDVRVGDRFMTSGLGRSFPEGFLLGQVSAVNEVTGALRLEILLEPAAPMQTLEDVFVVTQIGESAPGYPLPLEDVEEEP